MKMVEIRKFQFFVVHKNCKFQKPVYKELNLYDFKIQLTQELKQIDHDLCGFLQVQLLKIVK